MLYICYARILFYFVEKPQGKVLVEQVFISQLWKLNQGVSTYGEQEGTCGVRNQDSLVLPFHYPQHSSSCFYLILQEGCLCSPLLSVFQPARSRKGWRKGGPLHAKDISKKLHSMASCLGCIDQRITLQRSLGNVVFITGDHIPSKTLRVMYLSKKWEIYLAKQQ